MFKLFIFIFEFSNLILPFDSVPSYCWISDITIFFSFECCLSVRVIMTFFFCFILYMFVPGIINMSNVCIMGDETEKPDQMSVLKQILQHSDLTHCIYDNTRRSENIIHMD